MMRYAFGIVMVLLAIRVLNDPDTAAKQIGRFIRIAQTEAQPKFSDRDAIDKLLVPRK